MEWLIMFAVLVGLIFLAGLFWGAFKSLFGIGTHESARARAQREADQAAAIEFLAQREAAIEARKREILGG